MALHFYHQGSTVLVLNWNETRRNNTQMKKKLIVISSGGLEVRLVIHYCIPEVIDQLVDYQLPL